jgi:hypothetical protein
MPNGEDRMIREAIIRLEYLCVIIPPLLVKIPEEAFSYKLSPEKWSKKEILGHLIDSATNNHHRFVRSQFENTPLITYDQNNWNRFSYHNQLKGEHLIAFWTLYNLHLIELMKQIPEADLKKECNTGGEATVTIEWLFNDYVKHHEHHLKQITEYE